MDLHRSEMQIIGACLINPDLLQVIAKELDPEAFSIKSLSQTFSVMKNFISEGKIPDVDSIVPILEGELDEDELEEITSSVDRVSSLESVHTHVDLIKDSYARKRLKEALQASIDQIDEGKQLDEVSSSITNSAYSLVTSKKAGYLHVSTGDTGLGSKLYDVRMQILHDREQAKVLHTGIEELDRRIPTGFPLKDISVIAGRPGMGKSLFRWVITRHLLDRGFGGILISTEQTKEAETDRMDSNMTRIELSHIIKSPAWGDQDSRMLKVQDANRYMQDKWNYDMLFSRQISLSDVGEFIRICSRKRPKQFVFIDLFDRLTDVNVEVNKPTTVTRKIGEIAALAELWGVHIGLLVQIGRKAEARANKHPRLSDLKDSGNYEEAARLALLLYRDAYYNPETLDDKLEINIAKQSQGASGPNEFFEMRFIGETMQIEE